MWERVLGMLRARDSVGRGFNLCCPRHPETVMNASHPEDFARLSPEGGCQLACDRRLDTCGHTCMARCHSDSLHRIFSCPKPCERLHSPCNHSCQKQTCGEDCGLCLIKLNNVELPCGHLNDGIFCWTTQDLGNIPCSTMVQKQVPRCDHVVSIRCSVDVALESFTCPADCGALLECGHICPGTCGRCNVKDPTGNPLVEHARCKKICGRPFGTCNHKCGRNCHIGTDCGPCYSPCEVCTCVKSSSYNC